jgi:hypothetical protein
MSWSDRKYVHQIAAISRREFITRFSPLSSIIPLVRWRQEEIRRQYPQLTAEGLAAAFQYAALALKGEQTWELRITA